jgi:ubiquinone/menaquinone biosynthesis C-methylase UbiE
MTCSHQKDDLDFYKELALERGKKVLELGVGTGRVAIELAKANISVWGIDTSRYMLKI